MTLEQSQDWTTAKAFSRSWLHAGSRSTYTQEQARDWFAPLAPEDFAGREVTELGCGNASLLIHAGQWQPRRLRGVELGSSIDAARRNLAQAGLDAVDLVQADLVAYRGDPQDLVYCIGVLHHLKKPQDGFDSVLANTRPGGKFHCWVYAHEGNGLVRLVVEPVRKVASHLPWWLSKHVIATGLVAPYYVYAKLVARLPQRWIEALPLGLYSQWIARREFAFFRHVAFDQIVTPQTAYLRREEIEAWLRDPRVEPGSAYVVMRNGNSWKFGGVRRVPQ
jgi:SAM-dependent methyltransferase